MLLGRLTHLLRAHRYDIVHTHLVHAGIAGKLVAALRGSTPVVTTRHYAWDHKEETFLYRLENRLTRRCATVVAVSDAVRAYLIDRKIARADRIVTIPNGVDLERFDPSAIRFHRDDLASAPRIGMVGRLHPQKGHSVGLRAFSTILHRHPDASLEIIGRGDLQESLEREAGELGIAGRVHFHGSVSHADIARQMASWDLAVFPSLWEGFGIAAAEAMAMELPVVASRVEGLAEVVEDGTTGLLVPSDDPRALADAVVRLLSNRAEAEEMGRRGRIRIADRFSIQSGAVRLRNVYASILTGP